MSKEWQATLVFLGLHMGKNACQSGKINYSTMMFFIPELSNSSLGFHSMS